MSLLFRNFSSQTAWKHVPFPNYFASINFEPGPGLPRIISRIIACTISNVALAGVETILVKSSFINIDTLEERRGKKGDINWRLDRCKLQEAPACCYKTIDPAKLNDQYLADTNETRALQYKRLRCYDNLAQVHNIPLLARDIGKSTFHSVRKFESD